MLNTYLQHIYYNDSGIVFAYSVLKFMKKLKQINEKFFSQLLVKASLVYVESAKISYQRKNMQFNQMYMVNRCGYGDIQGLKTLMKSKKINSKTSGNFSIMFTPSSI